MISQPRVVTQGYSPFLRHSTGHMRCNVPHYIIHYKWSSDRTVHQLVSANMVYCGKFERYCRKAVGGTKMHTYGLQSSVCIYLKEFTAYVSDQCVAIFVLSLIIYVTMLNENTYEKQNDHNVRTWPTHCSLPCHWYQLNEKTDKNGLFT